ncbi:MAG TPA: GntR family transcriptional regulator [Thermoleophilaceae bacterium]|jgi:DNA-binding GntR family transcriptional regulator|nr:GntR family transcriptional regulator [Thermoleophilaceae bacterium]
MGPLTSGDALDGLEIRRASTSDQVADAVRTMILRGQLPPGTQLREVPLAESIGISRNTVREAVRVLARQGLVTHSMHRGAVVTRLTEHDVVDLIRARRTLESQAIEAAGNAAPDELRALDEIILELERAATDGDWDRMVDADWSFHRRLVSFLGSPRLDRFFETIQAEMRLCLSILDREDDDPDELVDEHRELRDLIANRATERCIARLGEHLDDAELRLRLIARSWEEQTKQ